MPFNDTNIPTSRQQAHKCLVIHAPQDPLVQRLDFLML